MSYFYTVMIGHQNRKVMKVAKIVRESIVEALAYGDQVDRHPGHSYRVRLVLGHVIHTAEVIFLYLVARDAVRVIQEII